MKLTHGKLRKQDDWNDWKESEYLQLDQYEKQYMFGAPVELDTVENVFDLVWTYVKKSLISRRKHDAHVTVPHDMAKYEYLATHMQTALVTQVLGYSMLMKLWKISSFSDQMFSMRLGKPKHRNRVSISAWVVPKNECQV